jgi:cation diffusion facilitator family transporter
LASNALIAVAKIGVGVLTGSSAMLAEGAHSVADTTNELFLLTALHRSAKPADAAHPFGYGMERFFWSLLAAVGIFVSGAIFSLYQGVEGLLHGESGNADLLLSYVVLGIAFVAEGTSWLTAVRQLRREARSSDRGFVEHLGRSTDPTVKTVFSEDAAALIGLALAAIGIGLHHATGSSVWDAGSAIAIGLLLAYVAFRLGHSTKELLIGAAADPELRQQLWTELAGVPEVDAVVEVLTMQLAPREVLVAARLDLVDGLDSEEIERVSAHIDADLQDRHPEITQVFLDATRASSAERGRSRRIAGA